MKQCLKCDSWQNRFKTHMQYKTDFNEVDKFIISTPVIVLTLTKEHGLLTDKESY
jgi:hypothetical protein